MYNYKEIYLLNIFRHQHSIMKRPTAFKPHEGNTVSSITSKILIELNVRAQQTQTTQDK